MKPGKQGPKHRALQGPGRRLKASGPGAQKLEGWKETFKRKACTIKRDPREGGVSTELALHNKKISDLNPDLSKPKSQGFGATFGRIWATFGTRSTKTSSKICKPQKF